MASSWRSNRSWNEWMTTGGFALIVSGSALLSVAFCAVVFFATLASDAGMGVAASKFGKIAGPHFGKIVLMTILLEAIAIISLATEAARWGLQVRNRSSWIASVICTLVASVATAALAVLYLLVATSYA